jgi:hypothetical protein
MQINKRQRKAYHQLLQTQLSCTDKDVKRALVEFETKCSAIKHGFARFAGVLVKAYAWSMCTVI